MLASFKALSKIGIDGGFKMFKCKPWEPYVGSYATKLLNYM